MFKYFMKQYDEFLIVILKGYEHVGRFENFKFAFVKND